MMRPLLIAASPALFLVAFAAAAQDPDGTAEQPAADAVPVAAPAAVPTPAAITGDAARGKGLAYTCRGCHGIEGYKNAYPSYHVPRLGGQSETYLRNALMEYRAGNRQHPTMQAQSQSFSEQDIADIAAFLSTIK